jgi:uncharacterized cysteine cluster protein YcgN (CxxCxxCC family)
MRKCNHCGECCRLAVGIANEPVARLTTYCPARNRLTGRCDIYDQRFRISEIVPGLTCNTAQAMIEKRIQPSGCNMVSKGYRSRCRAMFDTVAGLDREMEGWREVVLKWKEGGYKNG